MAVIHFLNVKQGDCSAIQHNSGRVSVIDVNNARSTSADVEKLDDISRRLDAIMESGRPKGNYNQAAYPVNPIGYLRKREITSVFRFVLTHPDMDHMDGLEDFFDAFSPPNFWDIENDREHDSDDWDSAPYQERDWLFYKKLRSGSGDAQRLLYTASTPYLDFWKDDGLSILAPTPELVAEAGRTGDYNDCSYVLLYRSNGRRVVFAGDSDLPGSLGPTVT